VAAVAAEWAVRLARTAPARVLRVSKWAQAADETRIVVAVVPTVRAAARAGWSRARLADPIVRAAAVVAVAGHVRPAAVAVLTAVPGAALVVPAAVLGVVPAAAPGAVLGVVPAAVPAVVPAAVPAARACARAVVAAVVVVVGRAAAVDSAVPAAIAAAVPAAVVPGPRAARGATRRAGQSRSPSRPTRFRAPRRRLPSESPISPTRSRPCPTTSNPVAAGGSGAPIVRAPRRSGHVDEQVAVVRRLPVPVRVGCRAGDGNRTVPRVPRSRVLPA